MDHLNVIQDDREWMIPKSSRMTEDGSSQDDPGGQVEVLEILEEQPRCVKLRDIFARGESRTVVKPGTRRLSLSGAVLTLINLQDIILSATAAAELRS